MKRILILTALGLFLAAQGVVTAMSFAPLPAMADYTTEAVLSHAHPPIALSSALEVPTSRGRWTERLGPSFTSENKTYRK